MRKPDPRSFEERTAEAIRNLTVCLGIVGVALVAALVIAAFGLSDSSTASSRAQTLAGELKTSVQSPTHGKDIALWCNGINSIINYERQYTTGTVKQSESEAQTIEKAIASPSAHGLSPTEAAFIRLYLDSVVALEREAPQTLKLHPFALPDLNCGQIEAGAAAAAQTQQ